MSLRWSPVVELSGVEERVQRFCKKAPLFAFLRKVRQALFDEGFQAELIALYPARTSGSPPPPPALLAMVTLLQAARGVSDQEAVRLAATDRCWQMVLDTLDLEAAPFAQSTLVEFRAKLIAADLDRRLLERTVAFARAAFDASPLFGAGRVEDTFNLLGHAARDVVRVVATDLDVPFAEAARRAGIPLLTGTSLKAALDLDWDDPAQRAAGLRTLLAQLDALGAFVRTHCAAALAREPLASRWATVEQLRAQDTEPDPDGGGPRLVHGVAKDRRVSVTDADMRHGRKTRRTRFDGYKRHVAPDLATRLILAVAVTRANRPEGEAATDLVADVTRQGFTFATLQIDRAYLEAPAVQAAAAAGTRVVCKAPALHNGGRYTKAAFALDLVAGAVTCPAGVRQPLTLGTVVHFPTATCATCAQRPLCTRAKATGRSLAIHVHEPQRLELRARQKTPDGRAELRARSGVEHRLAHLGRSQGKRARYRGERKNLFDLRRHAAVHNLFVAMKEAA
jgi:hypothetical protein